MTAAAQPARPPRAGPDLEPAPISFVEVLVAARRHLRALAVTLGIVAAVTIAGLLALRNYYTSRIAVVPEIRQIGGMGQLAGLAALAGLNVSGVGSGQSPQFYEAILRNRTIQYAVVQRAYPAGRLRKEFGKDSVSLVEVIGRKDRSLYDYVRPPTSEADRVARAAKRLGMLTDVGVDVKSGIVHLSVSYWDRDLAADIANAYADELLRFNAETRQSQARSRRIFLDGRVAEAEADLRRSEDAVRRFMERNRTYESAPALRFEYANLERALTVQQELFLDLRRQLDGARIQEVDDVPALTVIERGIPAQRKSYPNRTVFLIATLVVTAIIASGALAIWEYRNRLFPSTESGGPSHGDD